MEGEKKNLIFELLFQFSLNIIVFSEWLESKRNFKMADQPFRSGTSISVNIKEAQSIKSKTDCIYPFNIALKETEKIESWFLLCSHPKNYPNHNNLLTHIKNILNLLEKTFSSSRKQFCTPVICSSE
jgi:four helix bundle protein